MAVSKLMRMDSVHSVEMVIFKLTIYVKVATLVAQPVLT